MKVMSLRNAKITFTSNVGADAISARDSSVCFVGTPESIVRNSGENGFRPYKLGIVVVIFLTILLLFSCSPISVQFETFEVMNATANSQIITMSNARGRELNAQIGEILSEVEGRISRHINSSEIGRINELNNSASHFALSSETAHLLRFVQNVQTATGGAFSPTLGEIKDLWNISDQNENPTLPLLREFTPALERSRGRFTVSDDDRYTTYGYDFIMDLDHIAKGYALNQVSRYLEREGVRNAFVSFDRAAYLALGRDRRGELWQIEVRDPLNLDTTVGVIQASDKFIAIVTGYERYITIDGINYIRIIDPLTGYPVDNDVLAVVVITDAPSASMSREQRDRFSDNGTLASSLAHALFVMGRQGAVEFHMSSMFDFEMILFTRSDTEPRGYEILRTNVIFYEIGG